MGLDNVKKLCLGLGIYARLVYMVYPARILEIFSRCKVCWWERMARMRRGADEMRESAYFLGGGCINVR